MVVYACPCRSSFIYSPSLLLIFGEEGAKRAEAGDRSFLLIAQVSRGAACRCGSHKWKVGYIYSIIVIIIILWTLKSISSCSDLPISSAFYMYLYIFLRTQRWIKLYVNSDQHRYRNLRLDAMYLTAAHAVDRNFLLWLRLVFGYSVYTAPQLDTGSCIPSSASSVGGLPFWARFLTNTQKN